MNVEEHEVLEMMISIYKPEGYDWMGYKLQKDNPLTYHHIVEKHNGGVVSIINGALLTKRAHQKLNKIKRKDPWTYDMWQVLFIEINRSQMPPTEEHKGRMLELKMQSNRALY